MDKSFSGITGTNSQISVFRNTVQGVTIFKICPKKIFAANSGTGVNDKPPVFQSTFKAKKSYKQNIELQVFTGYLAILIEYKKSQPFQT